jgi:hypothetical protein
MQSRLLGAITGQGGVRIFEPWSTFTKGCLSYQLDLWHVERSIKLLSSTIHYINLRFSLLWIGGQSLISDAKVRTGLTLRYLVLLIDFLSVDRQILEFIL